MMKQTEIGLIPDDWEVKSLEEVTFNIGDGIHTTPIYSDSGNFFFINGNNIKNGKIIFFEETKRVSENNAQKYIFPISDKTVLMSINGTIGNVAFYNKENIVLGKSVAYLTANNKLSKFYLFYILQSDLIKKQFNNILTGTTIQNLGLSTIRATLLPVPPLAEQQRIAKALSDVDSLISTTEKLIQKKKNIKQGAMQDLLTGKKRLPGFGPQTKSPTYKQTELGPIPDDWEVKNLCSYASLITKGTTPTSIGDNFTDSGIKFIKIESLTSDYKIDLSRIAYISESTHKRLYRSELKRNDLLISIAGALGKTAIVESNVLPANTNQALAIVRLSDNNLLNVHFLLYWINSKIIQEMIKDMSVTGAQPNISLKNVNDLPIIIPSKEEQTAIVNILSSMDKEIETLNTKLEKYRSLKTAMMQQLLTGKIRLG